MKFSNVSRQKANWWNKQDEDFKVAYANRFWASTRKTEEGCIEFTGPLGANGYGRVAFGEWYSCLAHMVSWVMERGGYHPFLELDHICCNRACVNTDHLRLVTRPEHIVITNKARRDNPNDKNWRYCDVKDEEYDQVVEKVEAAQYHRTTCQGNDSAMDKEMASYHEKHKNALDGHNREVMKNLTVAVSWRNFLYEMKQDELLSVKAVDEEMAFFTTVLNPPSKGDIMLKSKDLMNEAIREMSDLGITDDEYESIIEDLLILLPKRRWRSLAHKLLAVTTDLLDDMIDMETAEEEIFDIIEDAHLDALR